MLEEEIGSVVTGSGETNVCTTLVVEKFEGERSDVSGSELSVTCEVSEVTRLVEERLVLREGDGTALRIWLTGRSNLGTGTYGREGVRIGLLDEDKAVLYGSRQEGGGEK